MGTGRAALPFTCEPEGRVESAQRRSAAGSFHSWAGSQWLNERWPKIAIRIGQIAVAGVGGTRLELVTSTMSTLRSNQLS